MDVPQIQYAPIDPEIRRRRVTSRMIRIALLLAIAIVAWRLAPIAWRKSKLMYWQQKAMDYSAPADQIVFDDFPEDIAKLLNTGFYTDDSQDATRVELALNPSKRYFEVYSPTRVSRPTLFLHERQNGKGERRLVVVDVWPGLFSMSDFGGELISASVLKPGTWLNEPSTVLDNSVNYLTHDRKEHFRYFAGQADPNDPTHFTITYELGTNRYVLHAWLRDDDTIKFDTRVIK
jgi:hypothetical protein